MQSYSMGDGTEIPASNATTVWLTYADSDLQIAEVHKQDTEFLHHVCFHAQQAGEKYLKGFMVHHGIKAHRTHDLMVLLEICASVDSDFESWDTEVARMTDYAASVRYPFGAVATPEKTQKAIRTAKDVQESIKGKIEAGHEEGTENGSGN